MTQRWTNLLFMHWPTAADALQALIPAGLELDLFQTTAWISITPFHLSNLHPRGIPALPWVSEFLEVNVRTYVVLDGKPGVFFFSLDAEKLLPVVGARVLYHLPYYRAAMRAREAPDGTIEYESRRVHVGAPAAQLRVSYTGEGPITQSVPGSLDHWLTERYCLYAVDSARRVHRADIHHHPWPLQAARCHIEQNTMAAAAGITVSPNPHVISFSGQLDVVVWASELARGSHSYRRA